MTEQPYSDRQMRVFLAHSRTHMAAVRELYHRLKSEGFAPWLDEVDLLPGQPWQEEISRAIRAADVVLVCLSRTSVTNEEYLQKEVRLALDLEEERPEGATLLIPVKMEEVEVPLRLARSNWVNLFQANGYELLVHALRSRAQAFGLAVNPPTAVGNSSILRHAEMLSSADFTITFAPELSPEQITSTLQLLADYYRVCGGVGFEIDFELEEARAPELAHV